jgi:Zn-dependent protease with chaperone function
MEAASPIKSTLIALLVFSFLFLLLPSLEGRVKPTSGFDLFSAQEELQAGKQAAADVSKQLPLLPESDPTTKYVQRLGQDLASHAPGEKWPYSFRVVNQKEINAFALPGGAIFVNLGTIQAADNEAELAGVMAHEISHVVQRHGTRAASKQMAAQLPLAILGGMMGNSTLSKATQMGISFGVGSYFLKNSRQSESEADLLGTDIMYDTGYDPHAMAQFFSKLEEQMGRGSAVSQFMSDHPNPGNRAEAVSREVATLPVKHYRTDSAEFRQIKQRVDKMQPMTAQQIAEWQKQQAPAGASAAAPAAGGMVAPSAAMKQFSHSQYEISYPENWQVFGDQSSTVTLAPQNGVSQNAIAYGTLISSYQPENANASLDDATHGLLASMRQSDPNLRQVGNDENIRVNGAAGKSVDLIGVSPIKDQNGNTAQERDWLVAVKRNDGSLLYLVFIAPDKDFSSLRPTFEQMLRSLKLQ